LKILHVTPFFHGAWAYGGIPRLSFHLAEAQARQGHTVHAVTTDARDRETRGPAGEAVVSAVRVRSYPNLSNPLAYHYQLFFPRGLWAEAKSIRDYDLVHIHGHRNMHNTRMAAFARKAGVPTVLHPNGTLVNIERRRGVKFLYDLLWGNRQVRGTDAFVAVAEIERRQFLELGIAEEKIRVIPNGVTMEDSEGERIFKKYLGIEGNYLLYLGKITPRKGVEYAIEALRLLEDKSIKLVVAGNDMGYERVLRKRALKCGVEGRVMFPGLVTGAMKSAAYREALYTVYPGREEIFGLVPWESILCGTPVIVADDSGCGEWVARAGAGHVVPYADAMAIARVINKPDPRADKEMIERGRAFCAEKLNWDAVAREMVQYYQEVLAVD